MMRFKVHNVDAVAHAKGFRRNHVYDVRGFDLDPNPERGPLLLLRNRAGKTEGFYPDQGRWVDRGPPAHRWLSAAPVSARRARKLVREYRRAHPPMARVARAMQAPHGPSSLMWAFDLLGATGRYEK